MSESIKHLHYFKCLDYHLSFSYSSNIVSLDSSLLKNYYKSSLILKAGSILILKNSSISPALTTFLFTLLSNYIELSSYSSGSLSCTFNPFSNLSIIPSITLTLASLINAVISFRNRFKIFLSYTPSFNKILTASLALWITVTLQFSPAAWTDEMKLATFPWSNFSPYHELCDIDLINLFIAFEFHFLLAGNLHVVLSQSQFFVRLLNTKQWPFYRIALMTGFFLFTTLIYLIKDLYLSTKIPTFTTLTLSIWLRPIFLNPIISANNYLPYLYLTIMLSNY